MGAIKAYLTCDRCDQPLTKENTTDPVFLNKEFLQVIIELREGGEPILCDKCRKISDTLLKEAFGVDDGKN